MLHAFLLFHFHQINKTPWTCILEFDKLILELILTSSWVGWHIFHLDNGTEYACKWYNYFETNFGTRWQKQRTKLGSKNIFSKKAPKTNLMEIYGVLHSTDLELQLLALISCRNCSSKSLSSWVVAWSIILYFNKNNTHFLKFTWTQIKAASTGMNAPRHGYNIMSLSYFRRIHIN